MYQNFIEKVTKHNKMHGGKFYDTRTLC